MTLTFNKNTTVGAFQSAFNSQYPFLKVIFFRHHNENDDIWVSPMVIGNQILLGELSDTLPNKWETHFTVSPNITIAEFESTFIHKYNLSLRIFIKDKGDWKETTDCRHLDLKSANQLATLRNQQAEDIIL